MQVSSSSVPESLAAMPELLAQLDATMADARLSDDERRVLVHTLREASPPEDGLRQLRNRAFDLVRARTADPEQLSLLKWLEGVVRAIDIGRSPDAIGVHSQAFFSPGTACLQVINQQLKAAKRSVDLCVFTLSDDRITAEVLAAHRRGVAVRFITDNDKEFDRGSDVGRLRAAGIPIAVDRTEAHMHHKFAIFDGARLLNGSYNWTRSACEHNEENVILSNDPSLLRRFADEFDTLWKELRAA